MKTASRKTLQSGLHVLLWKEDRLYVAKCVEVEVTSQGKTKTEALNNIQEAIDLFFEDEKLSPPNAYPNLELLSLSKRASYG